MSKYEYQPFAEALQGDFLTRARLALCAAVPECLRQADVTVQPEPLQQVHEMVPRRDETRELMPIRYQ